MAAHPFTGLCPHTHRVSGLCRYSTLTHEGKPANNTGPLLYSFFGHARNYHNWHWDARYPEDAPDYEHMATAGHNGRLNQDWLNWDREYKVRRSLRQHVRAKTAQ